MNTVMQASTIGLPHAWNKVNVDGQWNIVDPTNNDNDLVYNALFGLSDSAASMELMEDECFVLDQNRADYETGTDENEFYHINNRFFDMDEIGEKLAAEIGEKGVSILRTDYFLDDETFQQIANETAQQLGSDLKGFQWMGVIYLQK